LLKVRDDFKMTIAAYQSLYESSVLFGINKQIQAEEGKADLEKRIQELERQKEILTNKVVFGKRIANNDHDRKSI